MRTRTLLLGLGVLICGSAASHHAAIAAASSPSVNIRRIAALAGRVIPADFNHDGIVDLAAAAGGTTFPKPITVSLGKGDGTFGAPIASASKGEVLATGDFNKDGKLDLVAALDTGDMPLNFMPGNGDGTFGAPIAIGAAVMIATPFAVVADFDGDGNLDVAAGFVGESDDSGALVYAGHGDGTFSDVMTFLHTGALSGPRGAAVADLNHDGRPDLVIANHDAHTLSVFLNQGAFTFTSADIPLDRQANDVAVADVNKDGKLDLLVATSHDGSDDLFYIDGFVYVMLGNGDGTFGAPVQYATAPGAWQLALGDFNRDGVPDVATVNRSARQAVDFCGFLWDSVSILPGNADGTFGAASSFSLGNQSNLTDTRYRDTASSLAAANVNGDTWVDLVASDGAILINQAPDPNWPPTVTASATAPDANHSIALSAVANDVDQDRLSYAWTESGGQWIEPTATPCRFSPTTGGTHTFTVTVDDHHGHTSSSSVTVDFGAVGNSTPPSVTVTTPAAGAILDEAQPYTIQWTTTSGATLTGVSVSLSTDDGGHFQPIAECASLPGPTTSCAWHSVEPVTNFGRIAVTATDNGGLSGTGVSGRFTVRAAPGGGLPYGWLHADVGSVGAAGSASHDGFVRDGQALTVSGSGADIWGSADAFHFAWQHVTEPYFSIDARVDSLQNTNAWAKAGLMVRNTATDPVSVHASIFVSPSKGIAYQRRTSRGAFTSSTQGPILAAPVWLRITRQANMITALYRKNLTDAWTVLGHEVIQELGAAVDVGLPVTSHANGTLATAKFSGVFLQPLPNLSAFGVGSGVTGSLAQDGDGTTYTAKASGSDIWNTADNFVFFAVPIGANQQVTVRVRSLANTNQWAKAGVMIRESLAAGSKHADAIVSPSKGIAMQYRDATGGASVSAAQITGAAPVWLRIRRFESSTPGGPSSFQAQYSTDRQLWRLISNSVFFPMAHDAMIGVALTSHAPGVETIAVIDDIRIEP